MKKEERAKHNRIKEGDILEAYVRLMEALIFDAYEKLSVSKEWGKSRHVTEKTLDKKKKEVNNIENWLNSPKSDFWIELYESVCALNGEQTRKSFERQLIKSKRRLKRLSTR